MEVVVVEGVWVVLVMEVKSFVLVDEVISGIDDGEDEVCS